MAPPRTAPIVDAGSSTGNTTDPTKGSTEGEIELETEEEDEEEYEDDDVDNDMDFMLARERGEEDEDEYESASEGLNGIDIEFEVLEEGEEVMDEDSDEDSDEDEDEEEEEEEGGETETELGAILDSAGTGRPVFVTREQIVRMLGTNGLRRLLARGGIAPFLGTGEDDSEEDDDFGYDPRVRTGTRSSRRTRSQVEFEKVPSETGRELMLSGTFGGNERREDNFTRKKKLASRLLRREMGLGSHGRQKARDGLLRQVIYPETAFSLIWTQKLILHGGIGLDPLLKSRHNYSLWSSLLLRPIL
jgi:WD repeat-containing protein 23